MICNITPASNFNEGVDKSFKSAVEDCGPVGAGNNLFASGTNPQFI